MREPSLFSRVRATGKLWNGALVVVDVAVVAGATFVAYLARFEGMPPEPFARWVGPLIVATSALVITFFALAGMYRLVLRYVGLDTLIRLLGAVAATSLVLFAADVALRFEADMRAVPLGVLFIQAVLIFLGASGARLTARVLLYVRAIRAAEGRRVLIVGAGSAGSLLLREILSRPDLGLRVVGFLDDDPKLKGQTLSGVPVVGRTDELFSVVDDLGVEDMFVALPSAPRERIRALLNGAADLGIETRVMPELVIAKGSVSLRDLRPVEVEDLLGREPTPIDTEQVRGTVAGKVVAVTGAAGSIGSELCRQIVDLGPKKLLLLEIDETRLYELWLELENRAPGISQMMICDIRDRAKLDAIFKSEQPTIVLHAAAYKHVPLMELEPIEAVKTNVGGTRNVVQACTNHGVERFVLISTDKAVAPANTMGLTKRLAEWVMLDAARCCQLNGVAVRFGNVLGSRGSVVPIFEEQLRHGGPLTVTHPDVTRYFMTIPEAARLVLQAQAIGAPGDIFVLEMGEPVKIATLAQKMIALSGVPADIKFVGLRPGEKLHETLIEECEGLVPTERAKILRVECVAVPDEHFAEEIDALTEAARRADTAEFERRLSSYFHAATNGEHEQGVRTANDQ